VPPATGAVVMSTAILSVAFHSSGLEVVSQTLLVVAVAAWAGLAVLFVVRLSTDRHDWAAAARSPASLTGVAATAVIGDRALLLGWTGVAWALFAASAVLCLALISVVLRHWTVPTSGGSFLTCVGMQSVAGLAAALAGA
jgi:Voltage-dependent anion channel